MKNQNYFYQHQHDYSKAKNSLNIFYSKENSLNIAQSPFKKKEIKISNFNIVNSNHGKADLPSHLIHLPEPNPLCKLRNFYQFKLFLCPISRFWLNFICRFFAYIKRLPLWQSNHLHYRRINRF